MEYELAKKLKDAGFPAESGCDCRFSQLHGGYYEPSLSELIAECGEEFFALKVYFSPETEWVAMPRESGKTLQSQHYGKTPEEAVANLWLSLNGKNP